MNERDDRIDSRPLGKPAHSECKIPAGKQLWLFQNLAEKDTEAPLIASTLRTGRGCVPAGRPRCSDTSLSLGS